MSLTILTPTYNRREKLRELYDSLLKQNKGKGEMQWVVVDDGSTDETGKMVQSWVRDKKLRIQYLHKENGGKHTALNFAIPQITTELTFIVDSDDRLSSDAVETILSYHERYKEDENICGYSFLRMFSDGKINGKLFPEDEWRATYIEARIDRDDTLSDKAEVYKTRILKEFPFPEYPGEKFLGEDIVWIRIARKYKMVHINKAIYIGDYQTGGLTQGRRKHNIESPVGCMNRAAEFLKPDIKWRYRVKAALQYVVYGTFAGVNARQLFRCTSEKSLVGLCYLPGRLLYCKWKRDFERLSK